MSSTVVAPLPAPRASGGRSEWEGSMRQTVERLAAEVGDAVADGDRAVPETQRLAIWLAAEFLPHVRLLSPGDIQSAQRVQDLVDRLRGSHGPEAVGLAVQARTLVVSLA